MKRFFCSVITLACCALFLVGCSDESDYQKIARKLNLVLPTNFYGMYQDDHDNFLGDGLTVGKMTFDKTNGTIMASQIFQKWKRAPLPENLHRFVYVESSSRSGYEIPFVSSGFYYFLDRQSYPNSPKGDVELSDQMPRNFTLALYDFARNTLYYFEYDS